MIHILITSHGAMAQGMLQSAGMLIGECDNTDFVSFTEEMGQEELQEAYEKKITNVSENKQYLVLCDIKGGTPFNVVSRFSYQNKNIAVIYGINLPILVAAVTAREGVDLEGLLDILKEEYADSIGRSEL